MFIGTGKDKRIPKPKTVKTGWFSTAFRLIRKMITGLAGFAGLAFLLYGFVTPGVTAPGMMLMLIWWSGRRKTRNEKAILRSMGEQPGHILQNNFRKLNINQIDNEQVPLNIQYPFKSVFVLMWLGAVVVCAGGWWFGGFESSVTKAGFLWFVFWLWVWELRPLREVQPV